MQAFKNALMILIGAAGSIAIVLSCGGDDTAVPDATAGDAMKCDCPQPEPVEKRIHLVSQEGMSGGDDIVQLFIGCGVADAVVTGGTCDSGVNGIEVLQLKSTGGGSAGWSCIWLNPNRLVGVDVKATAICLFPEGTPFPDAGL